MQVGVENRNFLKCKIYLPIIRLRKSICKNLNSQKAVIMRDVQCLLFSKFTEMLTAISILDQAQI